MERALTPVGSRVPNVVSPESNGCFIQTKTENKSLHPAARSMLLTIGKSGSTCHLCHTLSLDCIAKEALRQKCTCATKLKLQLGLGPERPTIFYDSARKEPVQQTTTAGPYLHVECLDDFDLSDHRAVPAISISLIDW